MEASLDGSNGSSAEGDSTAREQNLPAYMPVAKRRQYLQQMVKAFPDVVQNRIIALKNLQLEQLQLEAKFFEEVYQLEKQYQKKYEPMLTKRSEIVNGIVDPPSQEPKWKVSPADDEESNDFAAVLKPFKNIPADVRGVPDFWLTVFRNTEVLWEMVQEHDEPVLKKLTDITISYDEQSTYTLVFHFDENEYFSNSVLTKQYFLKPTLDTDDPFSFEGPEIYKCKGCAIDWEKKMNLTVKTIRKKQKHKERGAVRTIVKQVPTDSFFNFFDPPQVPDDEEIDEESQSILATDFEIGHFLRARIIPKAVLYFTGDIVEDDEDDEYEEGDEESSEDEEEHQDEKKKPAPNECPNQ